MKTREDKRMVKLVFFPAKCPFKTYIKKSAHSFFDAWSFLLVLIWFTPSEGPKGFIYYFFKKSDQKIWTIKSDNETRPSSMVRLHGPWCIPVLSFIQSLKCLDHQ